MTISLTKQKTKNYRTMKFNWQVLREKKVIGVLIGIGTTIGLVLLIVWMTNKKENIDRNTTKTRENSTFNHSFHLTNLTKTMKWKQHGTTVIQSDPKALITNVYVDDNDTIYFSEYNYHRIMKSFMKTSNRQIVAGGNGPGTGLHQLWRPITFVFHLNNHSLIICDEGNRRIVRWSLENNQNGDLLISNVGCYGLALDRTGYLYVSNSFASEIQRWNIEHDFTMTIL